MGNRERSSRDDTLMTSLHRHGKQMYQAFNSSPASAEPDSTDKPVTSYQPKQVPAKPASRLLLTTLRITYSRRQAFNHPAQNLLRAAAPSHVTRYLSLLTLNLSLLILLAACPDPPEETLCGQGMILVNDVCECVPNSHPNDDGGSCECDTLYHWNEDLTECVLDTTSSDFTWVIDTLGIYGSEINDAAIIDENNIWVVGEIYRIVPDTVSGGMWETIFNVAHWDGSEWEYIQVFPEAPFKSIFAFTSEDIWFVDGCRIHHYNGVEFTELWQCDYQQFGIDQVTTIWGTSSSNMYFAGHRGNIVHYDGSEFQRIDTGIDTDFRTITGTEEGDQVFMVGNPYARPGEDVVIMLNDYTLNWERIDYPSELDPESDTIPEIFSCGMTGQILFVSGYMGLWQYNIDSHESSFIPKSSLPWGRGVFKLTSVSSKNDIFLGGNMYYLHFNGTRYTYNDEISLQYPGAVLKGGDYKDGIAVMTGYYGSYTHGLVAKGYR